MFENIDKTGNFVLKNKLLKLLVTILEILEKVTRLIVMKKLNWLGGKTFSKIGNRLRSLQR